MCVGGTMQCKCCSRSSCIRQRYSLHAPRPRAGAIAGLFAAFVMYKWRNRDSVGFTDMDKQWIMQVGLACWPHACSAAVLLLPSPDSCTNQPWLRSLLAHHTQSSSFPASRKHTHAHAHTRARTRTHTHAYTHTHTHTQTHTVHTRTHTHAHARARAHTHTHTSPQMVGLNLMIAFAFSGTLAHM